MPTGQTLDAFSKAARRHDIISQMATQRLVVLSIHSGRRDGYSRICSESDENQAHQSLRTLESAPTIPPTPPIHRTTTLTFKPEISMGLYIGPTLRTENYILWVPRHLFPEVGGDFPEAPP